MTTTEPTTLSAVCDDPATWQRQESMKGREGFA